MHNTCSRISPEDAVVLFADLQTGIVELSKTNPLERLQKGVHALAKLARLFGIPTVVTGVRGEGGGDAVIIPQIAEGLGKIPTHHRTTCDSFLDEEIVNSIRNTKRHTLLLSGVATELAVQLPALTAAEQGFKVYVVIDACGGIRDRTERAALSRMSTAGITSISVMTLAGEMAGDFREARAQQAIGILYEMAKD